MKALGKLFLIIIIIIVAIGGLTYIDYFLVVKKNTFPKLAIKTEYKEKDMIEYKGVFYKLWYCTVDKSRVIGSYSDSEAVCPKEYVYENGYYTNETGLKISQKDIELMTYENIYTKDMIELMTTEKDVKNATFVVSEYVKINYDVVSDKTVKVGKDTLKVVSFWEFVLKDKHYSWVANMEDETKYYCVKEEGDVKTFASYLDGKCVEPFEEKKMSSEWCELSKTTSLSYKDGLLNKYCNSES